MATTELDPCVGPIVFVCDLVSNAAGSAQAAASDYVLGGVASAFVNAAAYLGEMALRLLDSSTAVDLSAEWLRANVGVIAAVTLPLVVALFQEYSVVAPLANAVAIPVVGWIVVPLAIAGAFLGLGLLLDAAHAVLALLMVPLEAMARGVAVVATAVSGTPEIVRHEKSGLLVPRDDLDALVAAIRRCLADARLWRVCVDGGYETARQNTFARQRGFLAAKIKELVR